MMKLQDKIMITELTSLNI